MSLNNNNMPIANSEGLPTPVQSPPFNCHSVHEGAAVMACETLTPAELEAFEQSHVWQNTSHLAQVQLLRDD